MTAKESRLRLLAGGLEVVVALEDVMCILCTAPLVPLPFSKGAIEGMAVIGGAPFTQIDLAQVAGQKYGKGRHIVVVGIGGRTVALRVDHVSFESQTVSIPFELSLCVQTLTLNVQAPSCPCEQNEAIEPLLQLLFVRNQGHIVGLPAASVERVDRIEFLGSLCTDNSQHCWLVRLNGELLPASPLPSHRSGSADDISSWGVIPCLASERKVWTVDSVIGLRPVPCNRLHALAFHTELPTCWYTTETGECIEIINVNNERFEPLDRLIANELADTKNQGDLIVGCGRFRCLLPIAMIGMVLETLSGVQTRQESPSALPVLNIALLFGESGCTSPRYGVVVQLESDQQVIFAVDEIKACSTDLHGPLRTLPSVPPKVAIFCDGVVLDEQTNEWVFRLRSFSTDAYTVFRDSPNNPCIGWLPLEKGTDTNNDSVVGSYPEHVNGQTAFLCEE